MLRCDQLPSAVLWDEASPGELREYRAHLSSCRTCRRRVFLESPDQLLFELKEEPLPEEFWIGFWPSLRNRLQKPVPAGHGMRVLRWAAVFVLALILALYSRTLEESPHAGLRRRPETYPLIEGVTAPNAKYYIFQADENEKIILFFDPDMDL